MDPTGLIAKCAKQKYEHPAEETERDVSNKVSVEPEKKGLVSYTDAQLLTFGPAALTGVYFGTHPSEANALAYGSINGFVETINPVNVAKCAFNLVFRTDVFVQEIIDSVENVVDTYKNGSIEEQWYVSGNIFGSAVAIAGTYGLSKLRSNSLSSSASIDLTGTGEYGVVKGHHVHAKAAFKGDIHYDPKKGFAISQDFMKANNIDHNIVTQTQRKLFTELAKSERPNTLFEHTRIAREALRAGGASEEIIEPLINQSLENLFKQGVKQPTSIPWNTK